MTTLHTDLLDDVERRLDGWAARDPRRMRVARWRTAPATLSGRTVEIPVLPAVGTRWVDRRHGYWSRRLGFAAAMAVAVVVLAAIDVGLLHAAADGGRVGFLALLAGLLVAFGLSTAVHWRADLVASADSGVDSPLPLPVRYALTGLSLFGLLTPALPLWLLVEQLPRFPVAERVAWELVARQLAAGPPREGLPRRR